MFCGECGHRWAPDELANARFCAECGAPRSEPPPKPVQKSSYIHSEPISTPQIPVYASAALLQPSANPSISVRHSIALPSNIGKCIKCSTPFLDALAVFCGECGHSCTAIVKAEEDLFGGHKPPLTQNIPSIPLTHSTNYAQPLSEAVVPPIHFNYRASTEDLTPKLSSLKLSETEIEPDGTGLGISIQSVTKALDMNGLPIRLKISKAFERSTAQEFVQGYAITRVNDTITLAKKENLQSPEEEFYAQRSLPDDGSWAQILRQHQNSQTVFTDPQFPPNERSLCRQPGSTLQTHVWKWKRIQELFQQVAYVEITMLDDNNKLICSMALKTPAEGEAIRDSSRHYAAAGAHFLRKAEDAVSTALKEKKKEHLLHLTTNMIAYMSEYVEGGVQRFHIFWKSLHEHAKPLTYSHVGQALGYRLDTGSVSDKVIVLVPVHFKASNACLFDRSRERAGYSGVGVQPGAIHQGRLGNAYLFGALSILSTSPKALFQLFPDVDQNIGKEQQYNQQGVYAVRFWKNHMSRVVVVDDYVPCNTLGKPAFASFSDYNEIYSLIVEKAYAKLYGGYDAIVGGQEGYSLQDFYGGIPISYELQETCASQDDAYNALSNALARGSLIGCSNDKVDSAMPAGFKKSCAYGILRLIHFSVQGRSIRLIQLRNSWRANEPQSISGPWSKQDPQWKAFSRAQKIACGFQFCEDDTCFMEFSAFYSSFNKIIESRNCYNYPPVSGTCKTPSQSMHIIKGEWTNITCGGRDAMHLNPQFQLFIPAGPCDVTIHLEQPSRRIHMLPEYPHYIAPVIFQNGQANQRKLELSPDLLGMGTFISTRSCVLEKPCPSSPKPFVISPVTYESNLSQSLPFTLAIFSSIPTALLPISESVPTCCVCQKALSGAFRTFTYTEKDLERVDRVCIGACVQTYRDRTTPVCAECHERIEQVQNRFSGRLFKLDGIQVHAECIDAYRIKTAAKCAYCHQAIVLIPGRFDGRYIETRDGKCHGECFESYQQSTAKRCLHCLEPVMKIANRFDGRFFKIEDALVHFECWDSYQDAIAPKCVQCFHAIVKRENKFDGRFYELSEGIGKVHFECWEAYQMSSR